MTTVRVTLIDVYVVRRRATLECLVLQRAADRSRPGSWETVHGHIEPGELPADAAVRELAEETGLVPARLYNLSRAELFYQHGPDAVDLIPVFVALVDGDVVTADEHARAEWLPFDAARRRFTWPRERRALEDIEILLGGGDAGPVEDVLRVC